MDHFIIFFKNRNYIVLWWGTVLIYNSFTDDDFECSIWQTTIHELKKKKKSAPDFPLFASTGGLFSGSDLHCSPTQNKKNGDDNLDLIKDDFGCGRWIKYIGELMFRWALGWRWVHRWLFNLLAGPWRQSLVIFRWRSSSNHYKRSTKLVRPPGDRPVMEVLPAECGAKKEGKNDGVRGVRAGFAAGGDLHTRIEGGEMMVWVMKTRKYLRIRMSVNGRKKGRKKGKSIKIN